MSDEALRGSERRWRGSGGAEALARVVHARVRAGALPPEAVAVAEALDAGRTDEEALLVAALVGHPWVATLLAEPLAEACAYHGLDAALDVALGSGPAPDDAWAAWLAALEQLAGLETLGDALFAVARRALTDAAPPPADPIAAQYHAHRQELVGRLIDDLGRWLGSPTGTSPSPIFQLLGELEDGGGELHTVGRTARALLAASSTRLDALRRWSASARMFLTPDALRVAVRDAVAPSCGLAGSGP